MKIKYDTDVDVLYIALAEVRVADSEQIRPGVIVHYDAEDNLVGVGVLHVKKRKLPIDLARIDVDVA